MHCKGNLTLRPIAHGGPPPLQRGQFHTLKRAHRAPHDLVGQNDLSHSQGLERVRDPFLGARVGVRYDPGVKSVPE